MNNDKFYKAMDEILTAFESQVAIQTGVKTMSGGFCTTDIEEFNDRGVEIVLTYGINGDYTATERHYLKMVYVDKYMKNKDLKSVLKEIEPL